MTTDDNELLSALVDGELQGEALNEAMALLNTNASAREQLQRFQLSSDVLHGYGTTAQHSDLTQTISAALADEPRHSLITETAVEKTAVIALPSRFWQQTLSLAVAASFGALAVVGVMNQADTQAVPMMPMAELVTSPTSEVVVEKAVEVPKTMAVATVAEVPKAMMAVANTAPPTFRAGNRWTVEEQEIEDRLNVYLVDHNEYAGASDIFSNARVIAYDSGQ